MDFKVFFKVIIIKTFYHLYCNDEKIQIYKFFLWNKYYEIKSYINSERRKKKKKKKKLADVLTKFSNRNKKK